MTRPGNGGDPTPKRPPFTLVHVEPLTEVATHCPYCALQCGMTLRASTDGPVEVLPRDFPTNRGGLCQKSWTAAALLDHPERLTTPSLRRTKGDQLAPV